MQLRICESARALVAFQIGLFLPPTPAILPQAPEAAGEKESDNMAADAPEQDAKGDNDEDIYGA